MAARDEVGEHRLHEAVRMVIELPAHRMEHVDQGTREHDVGEAQRRKHRVAERSGVKRSFAAIEAEDRRNRPSGPSELGLMIVLGDPRVRSLRDPEQRKAACQ